MPSFDVVSELDTHEVTNALDQANREVTTRFDFKATNSRFDHQEMTITLHTESEFQLKQMLDMLQTKLSARKVDIACLQVDSPVVTGKEARQVVTLRHGIETPLARRIVKMVKDQKLKVQAAIQGDQIRVTGKKRDELQKVIAVLKSSDIDMPLQYVNFRD